jgi:hypothetical protein
VKRRKHRTEDTEATEGGLVGEAQRFSLREFDLWMRPHGLVGRASLFGVVPCGKSRSIRENEFCRIKLRFAIRPVSGQRSLCTAAEIDAGDVLGKRGMRCATISSVSPMAVEGLSRFPSIQGPVVF